MENNTEIRKTETLHIRLTPDDKQLIEQYAKMMNFSMSAFIEILLHRKRIIVCENLGELIIQLSRIGNNINQIAHTTKSRTLQILLRRFQTNRLRRCRN